MKPKTQKEMKEIFDDPKKGFIVIDDYDKPKGKPTQKEVEALIDLIKKSGGKIAVATTPLRKNEY